MEVYVSISTAILLSFFVSVIISPLIIKITKKIKFNQPVYEYVEQHSKKSGTPTMGGLIFLFSFLLPFFILLKGNHTMANVILVITMGFGIIGFADDFLKIKFKHNEGLKPYQKILGQLIVAIIVAVFAYNSKFIMGETFIPFTLKSINMGIWYIPFVIIFFLAITNSVNLTDGLDGLAGGVTLVYLICFIVILLIMIKKQNMDYITANEYTNIIIFVGICIGGMLGYLLYNSHPATIFMGDTGSLALGGLLGSMAVCTKTILFVPFLGVMFVLSSVSVILQVLHYKRTKKRIFLMAPFHHHLEKKSMYETKIVVIYMVITAVMGISCILLTLFLT